MFDLTFRAGLLEDNLILERYQNTSHLVDLNLTVGTGEICNGTTKMWYDNKGSV